MKGVATVGGAVSPGLAGAADGAVGPARSSSRRMGTLRSAFRQRQMQIGAGLTGLIVLMALIGPLVAQHSPTQFVGPPYTGPSGTAPLGTDYLGRDVLSRVFYGGRSVVWMAVAATAVGMGLGLVVGLLAGYARQAVDDVIMWLTDVVLAFPQVVLVLLFVSMLGPKLWLIVLLVGVSHLPRVARLVRSLTRELVRREFVEAVEVIGVPRRRILLREVLPHITMPLMVELGLRLTWSIGLVAGISYLGFGLQPPSSDWGLTISENQNGLTVQPWAALAPIICIALFTIGTNLMTEGYASAVVGVDRKDDAG